MIYKIIFFLFLGIAAVLFWADEVNATHEFFCSGTTYPVPNCAGSSDGTTVGCFGSIPSSCSNSFFGPSSIAWDASSCNPSSFCGSSEHCTVTDFCGADGNYYHRDINCGESPIRTCSWGCGYGGCLPQPCDDACGAWSAGGTCGVGCGPTEKQQTRTCPPARSDCATTQCYVDSGCTPSCSAQTRCQSGQLIRTNADCSTTPVDTCGTRGCTSSPLQCNPIQYTLTVSKTGGGNGTITSSPSGINCGSTCSAPYDSGRSVTLTATPTGSDTFAGWSGDCSGTGTCTLSMDSNKTAQASFNQAPQVDAGTDQPIDFALPSVNATLAGTVTPSNPDTVEWQLDDDPSKASKISIASPNVETTSVTFTASGNYRFKLIAKSGAAEGSDTVLVTIRNNPPAVSIAGDPVRVVDFGFLPISLQGNAADDNRPSPLDIRWEHSGPGNAIFSNPDGLTTELRLTQAGQHNISFIAHDGEFESVAGVQINYGTPVRYGLIPCGVIIDNTETLNWDETDPCEMKHIFLLLQTLLSFALWKLVPLLVAILAVATGAIFFFQFGGPEVLTKVRSIWSMVGKGVLILLFSWLFLNFLLGVLDFNINIFGRWYEISA